MKLKEAIPIILEKGTNGINYDIDTTQIIDWLEKTDKRCNFNIVEIDFEFITLEFENFPEPLIDFCKEIYKICPDIIEQHYEIIGDFAQDNIMEIEELKSLDPNSEDYYFQIMEIDLRKNKSIQLWWD